jgi:hypothetical protein
MSTDVPDIIHLRRARGNDRTGLRHVRARIPHDNSIVNLRPTDEAQETVGDGGLQVRDSYTSIDRVPEHATDDCLVGYTFQLTPLLEGGHVQR